MDSKNVFWRSIIISSIFVFNIVLFVFGVSTAYENIQLVFRGEEKSAVEISEDGIRILDFYF